MRNDKFLNLKIIYPLILFLLIFIDGSITANLAVVLFKFPFHVLINLTFIWMYFGIHFNIYEQLKRFWLWILLAGVIFDFYYTGALGTYLIAFLVSVWTMKYLHEHGYENFTYGLIEFTFGFCVYFIVVYLAGQVLGLVNVDLTHYVMFSFLPSWILNIVIMMIVYYPVLSFCQTLND